MSLELQDPTSSLESSSPESPAASQATTIVSPSDDENSSIVTVRDNGEQLQLVCDTDAVFDSFDEHISNALGAQQHPDKSTVVQTVVEVVSPLIAGDGHANQISIATTGDGRTENVVDNTIEWHDENDGQIASIINLDADEQPHDDDSDEFELSLSDKMKNVLQELVENERVKLSFSKSITEDDERDSASECDEVFNNNNETELNASLTETNGNVVEVTTQPTTASSDDKDSLNANINEGDKSSNDDDQIVTETANVDTPLTDEQQTAISTTTIATEVDAEQDDDDDNSQTEKTVSTSSATDSSNKSINNNKKKKKKGKAKKK